MATNPLRNNRPDSSGVTGSTSGSAGDRTPPDLALWGIRGLLMQILDKLCFEAGGAIQTQSSGRPYCCGDPAYECLVADPALAIHQILSEAQLIGRYLLGFLFKTRRRLLRLSKKFSALLDFYLP